MWFTFLMLHWFPPWNATLRIHMAGSASGQDKTNPVFLLANRAGTMIARDIRVGPARKSYLFGHIWNRLLTKRIRSRWLVIGHTLFCVFLDLDNVFFFWVAKKLCCVVAQFSPKLGWVLIISSPPTHPSVIFSPYLTFVQYYRRCIFLGATSVYFYSIISFKLDGVLVTARTLFKPGGGV